MLVSLAELSGADNAVDKSTKVKRSDQCCILVSARGWRVSTVAVDCFQGEAGKVLDSSSVLSGLLYAWS